MAPINSALVEIKKVTELPDLVLALSNYFAHCGADGVLGKINIEGLANFIAPYVSALGSSPFVANTGSPLPNPIDKPTAITFVGAGTFTQTTGSDVTSTEELNVLFWSSLDGITGTWTLGVAISIELDGYATVVYVDDAVVSNSQNFDKIANLVDNPSYDTSFYTTGYQDTGNTFSGWGTAVGIQNNFSSLILHFKTRTSIVTSIRVQVRVNDKSGTILSDKTVSGLSLAASTNQDITIDLDSLVVNAANDNLYVMFACDQQINRKGTLQNNTPFPYPTYAIASYAQAGSQTMTFTSTTVSGSDNRATIIDFLNTEYDFVVSEKMIEDIKEAIPEIADIAPTKELATATSYFRDTFLGIEIWSEGLAAFQDNTSTFSGWGSPIGIQNNFDGIVTRIRQRGATPITSIYFELRSVDRNGTILFSGTKTITIAVGATADVIFNLGSNIPNVANDMLWFGYQCNATCTAFGISTAPFIYDTPFAFYRASGIQDGNWTALSGGQQRNIWAQVGQITGVISPTPDFLDEIIENLPGNSFTPTAEIIHQKDLYAIEGTEFNMYFENMIFGNMALVNYSFNLTCPVAIGKQYDRYFRVTPTAANATVGSYAMTLDVLFNGEVITTKDFTLHIATIGSGASVNRKVLNAGDSTLSTGANLIAAQTKLVTAGGLGITFVGTQGTAPNQHEGYGGLRFTSFTTAGVNIYYFYYTGVSVLPSIGAVYSNNGSQFTVDEINSGEGYFSCRRTSGSNAPNSSGTLTNVSGGGDATITFSSVTTLNSNPFWNAGTSALDIPNYLSTSGISMGSGDWVMFQLLINDEFGQTDDAGAESAITTALTACNTLITAWKAAVSGIRICIKIPIAPSLNQDAFAVDYGVGQTLARYQRNWNIACRRFLAEFDTAEQQTDNVFLMHYNSVVDRKYNMQHSRLQYEVTGGVGTINLELGTSVNSANTLDKFSMQSNGVHPSSAGYIQMGWEDYAFLKNKV